MFFFFSSFAKCAHPFYFHPHHVLVSFSSCCWPSFSKLYLLWCRMLSSERQYVAVLKGVEETYLPLLELSDTPASIRGKAETLFPNWSSLSTFHSQNLLPAMEGALLQSLLQQDCFSKYVSAVIRGSAKETYIALSNISGNLDHRVM